MYGVSDPRAVHQLQVLMNEAEVEILPALNSGRYSLRLQNLQFEIESSEELLILKEVFVDEDYRVDFSEPFHVIDIGMNAAIASLYFGNHPFCKSVFGFEPFPKTWQSAQKNLALNPQAAAKIKAFTYGVSDQNLRRNVSYCQLAKGRMTSQGVPSDLQNRNDLVKESIELKDAAQILNAIFRGLDTAKIVLKMDCEGEEHTILPHLERAQLLHRFDLIILEWHLENARKLCEILTRASFQIEFKNSDELGADATTGLLTARKCVR